MIKALVVLLGAALPLAADPAVVVAKMGGFEIRADEVLETIATLDAGQQAKLAEDPKALSQFLRSLVVQRHVIAKAVDQKWDQEPAVIGVLVRAREAALSESFIRAHSQPEASYPSAAELLSAYESSKDKLRNPRSYRLSQIYIAKDKGKLNATLEKLSAKGADFSTIAKSVSEDANSAMNGGEIGWLTEDQIQPEIRSKLPKLMLNIVSDPILLADGWHILKVTDIREPNTPTLEQIREPLIAKLRAERALQMRQDYLSKLVQETPIAINEIELGKLSGLTATLLKR